MKDKSILKDHLTNKGKVRKIMEEFPITRNSDAWLWHYFLLEEGMLYISPSGDIFGYKEKNISKMPNQESIIRVRAEIQNVDGEFLPTDAKILVKRKVKENVIRAYYSSNQSLLDRFSDAISPPARCYNPPPGAGQGKWSERY